MKRGTLRTVGLVLMVVVGAAGVLLPLLSAVLLALVAMSSRFPWQEAARAFGGAALLSVVVGLWIGRQGIRGLARRPSRPFGLPARWLWLAALGVLPALLLVAEPAGGAAAGILHILLAVLPACALLSLVTHWLRDAPVSATWRQVAAQVGSTLTIAIGWSMLWEFLVVLVVAAVAAFAVGATAPELLQGWEQPPVVSNADLLRHPGVLALILAVVAGAIPVIEEAGKFLAVGALFLVRRPSRAQALVWGIVSGATFGVYEAALANRLADPGAGAAMAVLRVGALLVHSCTAALISLGFYEWVSHRRPGRFFAGLGMGIGLHAVWNALAVGLSAALLAGGADWVAPLAIALGAFLALSVGTGLVLHRLTEL